MSNWGTPIGRRPGNKNKGLAWAEISADKIFELNVSIFIGIDMADKAEIFSTVNMTQTKVNRSLVHDLYAYQNKPSPFKTAYDITVALDQHKNGPFYRKIKRLGVTTIGRGKKEETLSQATVVRGILRHLPKKPELERNKGFLGRHKDPEHNESWRTKFFSDFYRNSDTASIFNVMTNYFAVIEDKWPTVWTDSEATFILNRTNGYNALIRFMANCFLHILDDETEPRVVEKSEFKKIINGIDIPANYFSTDNYLPGGSGSSDLYKALLKKSGL